MGYTRSKTFDVSAEYEEGGDLYMLTGKILWEATGAKAWKKYNQWKVGKKIINVIPERIVSHDIEHSGVRITVIYE